MTNTLVLFDIDGTLVRRAGPQHRDALAEAIRKTTGLDTTTDGIPVHGMLDQDILTQMLLRAGMSNAAIARAMPAIHNEAERVYLRTCPDIRRKTCPGVRSLLHRLRRRHIPLALVTGNLTRIGWKKLECAGLAQHFAFGAFAEMAKTRAGLARIAIRMAREQGAVGKDAVIALVGDAPSDILAARENGIRSIAVSTGISTAEELREHSPDVLLPDLTHFKWELLEGR
ncbi:MAG: Haloacid dehalogenase domain protein hydrolase [Bryobacterales bacterium]|nr:Haloacid dehalogenase domain protein hydrolase [Bryobacterales bacterium]